jgi:hypothetical protein
MVPSIQCKPEGCNECPVYMPPSPDFCTNGTIVAGEKNACGCQGPPKCERNSDNKIPEFCSSWFDGCNNCFVTDGKIMGCTKKYCHVMEDPKCLEYKVPDNCISWFDGCNACGVRDGTAYACTKKYCHVMEEPKCLEYKVPTDCISWFDGCNNCGAKDGSLTMCTLMYCENPVEPKCLEYAK